MRFRQVHLDFHTSGEIKGICKEFDKKQFQEALRIGHIDSITLFSKCHHGWAYHPSKANTTHPGLDFDLLGAQIEAAHEIGVKTPVYLSAGFDEKAAHEHPEWLYESADRTNTLFDEPKYHLMCMNTPYLDYLLEQIREVCENYDADGIFLDIVNVWSCHCPTCIGTMFKRGMNTCNPNDVLKLGEEVYANYLRRTREVIDSVKPGLPLFHNSGHVRHGRRDLVYANSHLELESLPTGGWGYDHFPMSARYVQNLGLDYLGMTGKFHTTWGEFGGFKHPNALRYETALSVAHGAKCSVGDQLSPSGKFDLTTYSLIGEAYKEIETKEPWLDNVCAVSDVAVLSAEARLNEGENPQEGSALTKPDTGAGRILIEGKYQFSVIDTQENFSKYKVIILPEGAALSENTAAKIREYLSGGGKLLASGESVIKDGEFLFDFGAEYEGENQYCPDYVRPCFDNPYSSDYIMYGKGRRIKCTKGTELAKRIDPYFNRTREHFCSHRHSPSSGACGGSGITEGKDGIYIAWDIFEDYAINGELIAKKMVCYALDRLLGGRKSLETDLGSMGVAALMRQGDRYIAHLLYAVPTKRGENTEIIEDIYPVYNVQLSVRLPIEVSRVYLAPQMKELEFKSADGRIEVIADKVDCHQMVVFE